MLLRPLRIRPLSTAGGTDRVAVRCNITTIWSSTRSIAAQEEPSKRAPGDLYDTRSADFDGGRPYD